MAESTLSLGYPDIAATVAHYLGYTRTSANWTSEEQADIDDVINSGLRRFYNPPSLDPSGKSHSWRFLRPVIQIVTVVDDDEYDLPDNFGYINGSLTFAPEDDGDDCRIISEANIRNMQQQHSTITGRPQYAATRPKTSDGTTGQRYELLVFPTPDAVYTLTAECVLLPNKITAANPYPLGGMIHAETILQFCLWVAEERKNDTVGHHKAAALELLQTSISRDKEHTQHYFGYNRDLSDSIHRPLCRHDGVKVTYMGVQY